MKNITKKTQTILFTSLIAAMILPFSGMNMVYGQEATNYIENIVKNYNLSESDKNELLIVMQNTIPVTVEPTDKQLKMIDKIEKIKSDLNSESLTKRASVEIQLEALKPKMVTVGIVFSDDFHENMDYWKKQLRANEELEQIKTQNNPSNSDYYTVHRLYYSCSGGLICDQGLWAYIDDYDWEYAQITLTLTNGNHIHLEHETSNLHNHSVTRDFDSYWTHTKGTTILETDTKFTTQYFTAYEQEIQDDLLDTDSAQTNDIVHSTMRLTL